MPAPLAVSLGDPAGVGPELIAEAWARREEERLPPFFVCGGWDILSEAGRTRGVFHGPIERMLIASVPTTSVSVGASRGATIEAVGWIVRPSPMHPMRAFI